MIYLDANATEILRPEARAAVLAALDLPGNPASVHAAGRAARRVLEQARQDVAALVRADPRNVVFTSGGTEADALALHVLGQNRRVVINATEHDAIRANAPDAAVLPVDEHGLARLDRLDALLADGPALLCLMLANNETGVVQNLAEAAAICRRHGALLHVDAVQAAGRIDCDLAALGADSLALSAHKIGGPKGAGALVFAQDRAPLPLLNGGGQERGWRGGTPALPALAGFGAAARACQPNADSALRDRAEQAAIACGAVLCGGDAPRLPNTTCLALPGRSAQAQLIALDLAGVQVSAGAACSSGKVAASHVLHAMGLGTLAGQAIRVSLPWCAKDSDIDQFIAAYTAMAAQLPKRDAA